MDFQQLSEALFPSSNSGGSSGKRSEEKRNELTAGEILDSFLKELSRCSKSEKL